MSDDPDPWWPEGYRDPAFVVQRTSYGLETGGDYVRGSSVSTLPQTALRYRTQTADFDVAANKALLITRVLPHTVASVAYPDGTTRDVPVGVVEIGWGWPLDMKETWLEVALVRSSFGKPSTPNDGQSVFRALKAEFTDDDDEVDSPAPLVYDQPLQQGQWYYYSLFFRTTAYDWIVGMTASVLVPRDYQHDEHLWNTLPPFYQYTDSNLKEGRGPLRKFLKIFGFELDHTREYVEQWQEVYHIDKTPVPLLRQVGSQFGVPYTSASGVGDIRYRSLIAGLPQALRMRGTKVALKQVVENTTKFQCEVSVGTNMLLLSDDSDFYTGTGSWATAHPDTDPVTTYNILPHTAVQITRPGDPPPAAYGRSSMRIRTTKATETANFLVTCGDGQILTTVGDGNTEVREIIPLYTGVTVRPGSAYGFSCQIRHEVPAISKALLMWFDKDGQPVDLLSAAEGLALGPPNSAWYQQLVQGIAPDGAVYAVPALYFTNRVASANPTFSKLYDVAGAQMYLVDESGSSVSVLPPDKYLTLGDPQELLGVVKPAQPDTTGFLLGE